MSIAAVQRVNPSWNEDPDAGDAGGGCRDALGRPLKDLRLSVIDQCNFRCTYCMPKATFSHDYPFLPSSERLSFDQLATTVRVFARLGVEKVRLTGGEPLLRKDIERLVEVLANVKTLDGRNMEIALTTNGSLLAAKAQSLRNAGLQRVTVSLDSIDDTIFRNINDVNFPVAKVLDGIDAAIASGLGPVKINTVVERGVNVDQILPIARRFKGTGVTVRFIEFMDVGGATSWANAKVFSSEETRHLIESSFALVLDSAKRGNATAENYRYADGTGEVGFISAMSHPFCGSCTRARVSADGKLFTCLFATKHFDLRPYLSPGVRIDDLTKVLGDQWRQRDDRYSELREQKRRSGIGRTYPTVRMSLVGG